MKYPKLEEVEKASHLELAKWHRFLPSPGMSLAGTPNFSKEFMESEKKVLDRIEERFNELGGDDP